MSQAQKANHILKQTQCSEAIMRIESITLKLTGGKSHQLSLSSNEKLSVMLKDELLKDLLREKGVNDKPQPSLFEASQSNTVNSTTGLEKALRAPILNTNMRTKKEVNAGCALVRLNKMAVRKIWETGNRWVSENEFILMSQAADLRIKDDSVINYLGGMVIGGVLERSASKKLYRIHSEFLNKYI